MYNNISLINKKLFELKKIAKNLKIKNIKKYKKKELINLIIKIKKKKIQNNFKKKYNFKKKLKNNHSNDKKNLSKNFKNFSKNSSNHIKNNHSNYKKNFKNNFKNFSKNSSNHIKNNHSNYKKNFKNNFKNFSKNSSNHIKNNHSNYKKNFKNNFKNFSKNSSNHIKNNHSNYKKNFKNNFKNFSKNKKNNKKNLQNNFKKNSKNNKFHNMNNNMNNNNSYYNKNYKNNKKNNKHFYYNSYKKNKKKNKNNSYNYNKKFNYYNKKFNYEKYYEKYYNINTKNVNVIIEFNGVLELIKYNYGFLRSSYFNYLSSSYDVYVSNYLIRKFFLKTGDNIIGEIVKTKNFKKYFNLIKIRKINYMNPYLNKKKKIFEHLTPIFPNEKFNLSGKNSTLSTRIIDLFVPIGKGQRGMIVAPPKTGKTTLLKEIANCISYNHPEVYLIILLIDERPEEVTDMKRNVNAEVISSTFDEPAEKHVKVVNIVSEKAKRMVEANKDVCIVLDSLTRMSRAFNTVSPSSGKVLSGGIDSNAMHKPKRFFGSARNIENGGSLTIIATALIDTGSKMDEVIFEEFKGTGNMELQLDRRISNKRIYPAIDLISSGTRKENLLLKKNILQKILILRKYLSEMTSIEAIEFLKKKICNTKNNEEFILSMNK